MAKKHTHPDIEHYRGKLKELISENKALRRQLKKLEKREHQYEDVIEDEEDRNDEGLYDIKPDNICPSCMSGLLTDIDLNIKILRTCNKCPYRKTLPK